MRKPATTKYSVLDIVAERWSSRAFSDKSVPTGVLAQMLEAARWAPSCYNDQPWRFIVASKENAAEFKKLGECLLPFNQMWALNAGVLILTVARLTFEKTEKPGAPNRHAYHDLGLAMGQMVMQGTQLGLNLHQMAAFDIAKARETYAIPEGFDPVSVVAIGYPGDPETLPEKLKAMDLAPRARKPFGEFVFGENWGNPDPRFG